MTKILVLNPVSTDQWNKITFEYLQRIASPTTTVVVKNLPNAPKSIETFYDASIASEHVVREAIRAEKEGFDAIVVNCFDDPGVDAARELVTIPILGAGETSMIFALLLGHRFAIISTGPNTPAIYHRKAMKLGIEARLGYVGFIDIGVLDLRKDEDKILKLLEEESRRSFSAGAEVVVLGCTGFIGFGEKLSKKINVPVIDPAPTTFKVAEVLATLNISHSKKLLYNIPKHKVEELLNKLSQFTS